MSQPATKYIRQTVINHLKLSADVTALVPADRIYPQQVPANPTWPYITLGASISTPFQADCMDGRVATLAVHGFARTTTAGSGETLADDIADAVAVALDDLHIPVVGPIPGDLDIRHISNNTVRDNSEASQFHSICQIEISLVA